MPNQHIAIKYNGYCGMEFRILHVWHAGDHLAVLSKLNESGIIVGDGDDQPSVATADVAVAEHLPVKHYLMCKASGGWLRTFAVDGQVYSPTLITALTEIPAQVRATCLYRNEYSLSREHVGRFLSGSNDSLLVYLTQYFPNLDHGARCRTAKKLHVDASPTERLLYAMSKTHDYTPEVKQLIVQLQSPAYVQALLATNQHSVAEQLAVCALYAGFKWVLNPEKIAPIDTVDLDRALAERGLSQQAVRKCQQLSQQYQPAFHDWTDPKPVQAPQSDVQTAPQSTVTSYGLFAYGVAAATAVAAAAALVRVMQSR